MRKKWREGEQKMKYKLSLKKPIAKEALTALVKKFPNEFSYIGDGEAIRMRVEFLDEWGMVGFSSVNIRPSEDNKELIVNIRRSAFPRHLRGNPFLEWDILEDVGDYLKEALGEEVVG
jgi:hypothetical protein